MQRNKKLAGAPIAMHKKGIRTDKIVLEFVRKNPRLTVRQIAKQLNWSIGRADGSINRLVKAGKIKVEHSLRRGVLIKKVFGIKYRPKPNDLVEIPRNMIDEKLWNKTVKVYALSRSTIGISSLKRGDWEEKSLATEQIKIEEGLKKFRFKLPERLSEFYELENSETSLSAMNDLALLTVESTILPVALPPTHPAEVPFEMEWGIQILVKGKVTYNLARAIQADLKRTEKTFSQIPSDLPDTPEKTVISQKIVSNNSETNELIAPIEVTN